MVANKAQRPAPPPSPTVFASDTDLFFRTFLKILDKDRVERRFVMNSLQRDYDAKRTARDLILKPRQKGFTTYVQGKLRQFEWTGPASTITLGKDAQNTQDIRDIADFYYNHLPDDFRPKRLYNNGTLTSFPGMNSKAVIGTAGSVNVGRGGTRTHFHGSEIGFWPDAGSIIAGALQAGKIRWAVMESTANGQQGWFYNECMAALDGDSEWKLHFYPWFADNEYSTPLAAGEQLEYTPEELELITRYKLTPAQIKWRRAKIRELLHSVEVFNQEYPSDPRTAFRASGLGYFGAIDHVFKIIPGSIAPDRSHRYVAGLDFGQQNDFTVLIVFDATANRQVDMLRVRRESWASMRRQIRNYCQKWHVVALEAEANSMGSTNIEALQSEFAEIGLDTSIYSFYTTAANKPSLMANYKASLMDGGLLLLNDDIIKAELNAARAVQLPNGTWTVQTPRDKNKDGSSKLEDVTASELGHGDTVVAGALANKAISWAIW